MTIRRQYSLPNCTLILEGLSNHPISENGRPSLDILMRFECHLATEQPLIGGRELLEKLTLGINQATQEWLSGVRHSRVLTHSNPGVRVQVRPTGSGKFELRVPGELLVSAAAIAPEAPGADASAAKSVPTSVELQLSTVQMFDLVEALDQLLLDSQTLPDLGLQIQPLSRRQAVAAQPIAERAAPLALGTTTLAAAAAACFFLPIPEVRRPEPPAPETETAPSNVTPAPAAPASPPAPTPEPQSRRFLRLLASAPMILAPEELSRLGEQLLNQIPHAGGLPRGYPELIYHLGVNASGQVVGYRPLNQAAVDFGHLVPLAQLLHQSSVGSQSVQRKPSEAIAQFRLLFRPQGELRVTVWAS